MNIDWEDKMLFLMGLYVPFYWQLREVRKMYIRKEITTKEAYGLLGLK